MAKIADVLKQHEPELLASWMTEIPASTRRSDLIGDRDFQDEARRFVRLLQEGAQSGTADVQSGAWSAMREFLTELSRSRARLGFSPVDTATFVFSFKKPFFQQLRRNISDAAALADSVLDGGQLLDQLGLYTTAVFQESREELIRMQQQEMLELSTPVVTLWEGVLALPLIGTLDSARTQIVMEALLQKIVETGATVAIIDITGVPTVDTLVAQHLLKTVTAARLMGADCIISGIRPQIAQTIVHLGVELGDVATKASLSGAFAIALARNGFEIAKKKTAPTTLMAS